MALGEVVLDTGKFELYRITVRSVVGCIITINLLGNVQLAAFSCFILSCAEGTDFYVSVCHCSVGLMSMLNLSRYCSITHYLTGHIL
jgi:hypothetical protein